PKPARQSYQRKLGCWARGYTRARGISRRSVPCTVSGRTSRRSRRQAATLHRVVLKHHQAVEQLAQSSQLLDLGKPQMLVRNQSGLAVLHLFEHFQKRFARRQLDPQRQRVDEKAPHVLNCANLTRPTL